ncbi:MAG: DNA primase, partial [Propionibacteriaceae bacterium]|nr:DNA primase [Propionibacteriaceae bacterium]
MAQLINPEDIEQVRSVARIDDIVSAYVTLKPAGSGTLKGLCPFHDEKSPSFQVTPARGLFYCFGCGKGGDTVTFVEEINNFSFREAIEYLASRYGVTLRLTDQGGASDGVSRMRLFEMNQAASDFFVGQLSKPGAQAGRDLLTGRGFSAEMAAHFQVGFAPQGGRELVKHLRGLGFREDEMHEGGLMRSGGWDYFQGRLIWPIRDSANQIRGFGARRLFDDDRMPAKYLNTPDTPIYKKSEVLYGLDLARTAIGVRSEVLVVEGYTDVMACHVAGITWAVATCGTAFGDGHARVVQRLMGDNTSAGKVIFCFDGDAAGQKAALRAFQEDSRFTAQTYAVVVPDGLDPCELRQQRGDQAVRDLVDSRIPLYRFVMANVVKRY